MVCVTHLIHLKFEFWHEKQKNKVPTYNSNNKNWNKEKSLSEGLREVHFHTLHTSNMRTRESSVTIQLRASLSTVFVVFCYGGATMFSAIIDLSFRVQTAVRAPICLSVSGIHGGEGWRLERRQRSPWNAARSDVRRWPSQQAGTIYICIQHVE